jgi:hypothetical protein
VPQPTQSASDDYAAALRLLAAAESPGVDQDVAVRAALVGIGYAVLSAAPRRARRDRHRDAGRHGQHHGGGSPRDRWLHGYDDGAPAT